MFDPISAAIMGGGSLASIASQLIGNSKQDKQNKAVLQMMQQQAAQQAQQQAELNQQLTAPVRDAYGNTSTYVPGQGWSTTLSPDQQRLLDLSEDEQAQQLSTDADVARRQMLANEGYRTNARGVGTQRLNELTQQAPYTREGIIGRMTENALRGLDKSYTATEGNFLRDQRRTGVDSGMGQRQIEALGRSRADATDTAMNDSYLKGLGAFEELETGRSGRLLGEYATLSDVGTGRDAAAPGAFTPNDPGANRMGTAAYGAGVGAAGAAAAANKNVLGAAQSPTNSFYDTLAGGLGGGSYLVSQMYKNANAKKKEPDPLQIVGPSSQYLLPQQV